jgi:Asp-tRNA(Asn)/Glu-tRNA(Gln) amidotransferase A subunit family amidase
MTAFRDYWKYDGLDLAELVRRKEVTAEEILDGVIARIETLNPKLGCVVLRMDEYARRQIKAGLGYGPFTGVPLMIKDLYLLVKDTPIANGSRLFQGMTCPIDQTLSERYRRAGFVFCGRTASPEFGLNMTSDPAIFGPTRNPWDLSRTAGGSSGGSSSAVAARLVPIAHSTDGGGSIRIPASFTGTVGMKPTRLRNPHGPLVGEGWAGLSAAHTITLTVRDQAATLDATSGPAEGDPYAAPPPERPYLAEVGRDPGRLRIAVHTKARSGVPVHAECVQAATVAARLCEELGHTVEEAAPEYDYDQMFEALWVLACSNIANNVDLRLAELKRGLRDDDLEPASHGAYRFGKGLSAVDYARATVAAHGISRRIGAFYAKYDVAISPVSANPALPLGAPPNMKEGDWGKYRAALYQQIAFTPVYNVSGAPAMSVPLHWTAAGLPVGTQLAAGFGNEGVLFRLAAQLEAARPWFNRLPPLLG